MILKNFKLRIVDFKDGDLLRDTVLLWMAILTEH